MDLQPGKNRERSKCSKPLKTNYDLTRHMVTHDLDANFKCQVSKYNCSLKRPSCDTCYRVFFSSANLRQHINTVHSRMDRPRFPCTVPECWKTYLDKRSLSKHMKTEHAEKPIRFPCTLCGKELKTKHDLENHISTHTSEKPYNCATCGRSFAFKGKMKLHQMTHLEKSSREVIKCHICPQTFLSRDVLFRHVRVVHENQRNHPCVVCDKRFSSSSNLRRHVEARHPANKELKIYSCGKCEYRSHSKHNLTQHSVRHNAARHGCYFCGTKFLMFPDLVGHCRVHTLEN
ncbi:oocyte zinc finger protein XlCOF26 [Folsomia candida]|uniref:C2H2-type domain-containing protein n=1 Tax=Folsomia candida TaxID=158441 RepID=A0A226DRQ9_FOLCA|nr:oocyte zinc finger protein XlCOF26 [Folsomia candida]OXA47381.1 hypothetical protein Fcan01_17889 [Folsomia candida]